jgi:glycosyltransferase involved in cell wall biosynthesis
MVALAGIYALTALAARVAGVLVRRGRWRRTGRIMVVGTFHNPNWYLSHLTPLARSGIGEVLVVVDRPQLPIDGVRQLHPPAWLARLTGRAVSKAVWLVVAGVRYRPDLYMGYHLVPGACSALIAGAVARRPTCYQMTSGPVEVANGGAGRPGPLTGRLRGRQRMLERLALAVVGCFDLVVVRGRRARRYLRRRGVGGNVAIITGSVRPPLARPAAARDIDMIFVGRLAEVKRPERFIDAFAELRRRVPTARGAVVGDGPLLGDLRLRAEGLALDGSLAFLGRRSDVDDLLARARVFVLTSRSEGLSIALAEAMAAGAVPVVARVGELGDLVRDGVNGYLVTPGRVGDYADRAADLLADDELRARLSRAAVEASVGHCSLDVIAGRWGGWLESVIADHARSRGDLRAAASQPRVCPE